MCINDELVIKGFVIYFVEVELIFGISLCKVVKLEVLNKMF